MSHQRNWSVGSALTSLSAISEQFRDDLAGMLTDTHLLLKDINLRARQDIEWLEARDDRFYGKVDIARVLRAMHNISYTLGENSQRYTGCAIAACRRDTDEERHKTMMQLGQAWFAYFLYPLKANTRRHQGQPSHLVTPRAETLHSELDQGASNIRRAGFQSEVLERDDFTCVVTGCRHIHHLPPGYTGPFDVVEVAHILKRAVAVFNSADRNSNDYLSAVGTLEIIQNYADLPATFLDDVANRIDDPDNGVTLTPTPHSSFDHYLWYFKATDVPNQYVVTPVGRYQLLGMPSGPVTFENRSQEGHDIALPNPKYLALHGAVAQILHLSGAGEVIDVIIDKFQTDEPAVQSGHRYRAGYELPIMMSSLHLVEAAA